MHRYEVIYENDGGMTMTTTLSADTDAHAWDRAKWFVHSSCNHGRILSVNRID